MNPSSIKGSPRLCWRYPHRQKSLSLPHKHTFLLAFTSNKSSAAIPPTDTAIDYSRGLCATSSHHKYMISSVPKVISICLLRASVKGSSGWRTPFSRCGALNKNIFSHCWFCALTFLSNLKSFQRPPCSTNKCNGAGRGGEKLFLDPSVVFQIQRNWCFSQTFAFEPNLSHLYAFI